MTMTPVQEAPLSPQWAFVVQLREGTALKPEALQGRVEHIVSGQAVLFQTLDDLVAFFRRVLEPGYTTPRAPPERGGPACR
jgi:hypothetical protein